MVLKLWLKNASAQPRQVERYGLLHAAHFAASAPSTVIRTHLIAAISAITFPHATAPAMVLLHAFNRPLYAKICSTNQLSAGACRRWKYCVGDSAPTNHASTRQVRTGL